MESEAADTIARVWQLLTEGPNRKVVLRVPHAFGETRIDFLNIKDAISDISKHKYELHATERIVTPALLIYRDLVLANIDTTLCLLDSDPDRWRPHVKTAKLGYVMEMLTARGVSAFKCATSLELLTAIRAGARDVLVAYPVMGENAEDISEACERSDASFRLACACTQFNSRRLPKESLRQLSRFLCITKKLLRYRFAECLITKL